MYLDLNLNVSMVDFYNVDWKFPFIISNLLKHGKKEQNLNVANHVVQALVLCSWLS
jgi:hypothetical protein